MTKRMLIDATHPEETRVVVIDGTRLEDFDLEAASKKQLKGNIYLARVTRVEPSLQAAFVEYGGNRHGFLAFSEIHPDYYRIPVEDREALLAEERAFASEEDDDEGDDQDDSDQDDQPDAEARGDDTVDGEPAEDDQHAAATDAGDEEDADGEDTDGENRPTKAKPETVGGDAIEEVRRKRKPTNRRYKIQEVVVRRQIMLVQVVKEERGNKGAALTTYLSLAGRYCVLMPNTARGGGVSRKITHVGDRKRLKQVVGGLDVPEGMAVIVRTAGSQRTKVEIKRDYEYLLRLWNDIRETTLNSTAPCLIYEEANLIKRSIRDLYTSDLDEVLVDGEESYRAAKDFMKTLIPSHAKRVKRYKDTHVPLLHRFQVESQLDAIHSNTVELKSGSYIVLNQTEALVAIDVNSGRATGARNIEETALRTNLEAAEEIARQLRLRDLAGLIVIDFIDMDESRNQHAVERRMKEAMKSDRARIQIGRISHFGLMELSRQRLRPSLAEASTQICPHCKGSGYIRSFDSTALHVLRVIEEEGLRNRAAEIAVHVPAKVALYILNRKRDRLAEIEARYGFTVLLEQDDTLVPPDHRLERRQPKTAEERAAFEAAASADAITIEVDEVDEIEDVDDEPIAEESTEDERRERGRPRRRRRGGRSREENRAVETETETENAEDSDADAADGDENRADGDDESEDGEAKKRRRRGRRGGRRRSRGKTREGEGQDRIEGDEDAVAPANENSDTAATDESAGLTDADAVEPLPAAAAATSLEAVTSEAEPVTKPATKAADLAEKKPAKPRRARRRTKAEIAADAAAAAQEAEVAEVPTEAAQEAGVPEAPTEAAQEAEVPEVPTEAAQEAGVPEVTDAPDADDVPISGETGRDETSVPMEHAAPDAEPSGGDVGPATQVETIDRPTEKPRKGWWRR
ncbi:MAG: ribonuclease E/G [Alphaproteobacteria bacterium]|nr:ribonuclease E/G [Alphaproteobacteria bacterium]